MLLSFYQSFSSFLLTIFLSPFVRGIYLSSLRSFDFFTFVFFVSFPLLLPCVAVIFVCIATLRTGRHGISPVNRFSPWDSRRILMPQIPATYVFSSDAFQTI
ncbi:hypothetical protein BDV27DRAFT_96166 [Aspergillus caelatus]|uniref:Uncharacterized protein n=1 Tax=Aspergillus caelatus TaxID=61420 RepID=A0A5N7A8Y5_9EURO|nr:uncharacterized protein BDV27DRAFT_96166 [Aspergillus caelatus]KAE8366103.1 hypothetical protein BDV27DRAFT_96166 [Aspergillus caelatus]